MKSQITPLRGYINPIHIYPTLGKVMLGRVGKKKNILRSNNVTYMRPVRGRGTEVCSHAPATSPGASLVHI